MEDVSDYSNLVEVDVSRAICRIDKSEYPIVGFGTYPLTGEICTKSVQQAIKAGYRIIDTATFYENFSSIGEALKGKKRSEYYLISKVWHDKQSSNALKKDLNQTLSKLKTDYIDAYLIHWPNSKVPIEETLYTMDALREEKKIRHIGLCNVTKNHLKKAVEVGVPNTWVQIEMHPFFYDKEVIDFCREYAIAVQAWRPLSLGKVQEDEILNRLGAKYAKTPCQIALRWIIQHRCIPIPRSSNKNHIVENLNIFDFSLSNNEMEEINQRAIKGERFRLKKDSGLGFTDEFDFTFDECWPN